MGCLDETGCSPTKANEFLKPVRRDGTKWGSTSMNKIKERFSLFVRNTVCSEARVCIDDDHSEDGSNEDDESSESDDDSSESDEEKKGG